MASMQRRPRRGSPGAAAEQVDETVVARLPRGYDWRGCRRYGGCQWWARCPEHQGDPRVLGELLAEVLAVEACPA